MQRHLRQLSCSSPLRSEGLVNATYPCAVQGWTMQLALFGAGMDDAACQRSISVTTAQCELLMLKKVCKAISKDEPPFFFHMFFVDTGWPYCTLAEYADVYSPWRG